jgi:2Fe-2S ferredoxin
MAARAKSDISIRVEGYIDEFLGKRGETLLEALLRAELPIAHSCGGNATCGTCRVEIIEGLSPVKELEHEFKIERGFREDERLACQFIVNEKIALKIPGNG